VTTKQRPLKEVVTCRSRSTELCRRKSSSLFLCFTVFHSFCINGCVIIWCIPPFSHFEKLLPDSDRRHKMCVAQTKTSLKQ
jgi:hypothetical protein